MSIIIGRSNTWCDEAPIKVSLAPLAKPNVVPSVRIEHYISSIISVAFAIDGLSCSPVGVIHMASVQPCPSAFSGGVVESQIRRIVEHVNRIFKVI